MPSKPITDYKLKKKQNKSIYDQLENRIEIRKKNIFSHEKVRLLLY